MSDLVVIVPTRGRPQAAIDLAAAFETTCTADTTLVFAIDADDPERDSYIAAFPAGQTNGRVSYLIEQPAGGTMVTALNAAAAIAAPDAFAVGFMGDDHRPRTLGWDAAYLRVLREHAAGTGIVYGDDLLQGKKLPTQCAMTANIITALGWMAPPTLVHLYVDNWWLELGRAVERLFYIPQVVVEHVHPAAGKSEWDAGYARVNAPELYKRDMIEMARLRRTVLRDAIAAVTALRDGDVLPFDEAAGEWRLFPEGTVPVHTTPDWYAGRDRAPHLEQDAHRGRLVRTADLVALAVTLFGAGDVVDLGAGDGGLLSLLDADLRIDKAWGYDLQKTNVDGAAERGVDVRYGDVVDGDVDWARIAVATEMLEHLVDPHAFVRRIAEHAEILVCSSPCVERPGSAYEFHTWCWSLDGYRRLLEQAGYTVVRQDQVGAFQVILAVRV